MYLYNFLSFHVFSLVLTPQSCCHRCHPTFLRRHFYVDNVVAMVDAKHGLEKLDESKGDPNEKGTACAQIAFSSTVRRPAGGWAGGDRDVDGIFTDGGGRIYIYIHIYIHSLKNSRFSMEKSPFSIGHACSNGWCSIVMFVFRGGISPKFTPFMVSG